MSRVLQPTLPTTSPVLPGTQVVTQMPMATAVNAGDYVYLTSAGYGAASSGPLLGPITIPFNGSTITGYAQTTGSLAATQYGPIQSSGTYSGSTVTLGQQLVAPTSLNSVSNSSHTTATTALSNGNFVCVYRTSANNYSFKIVSQAGATLYGPTVVASNVTDGTVQKIAICPIATGGFAILYAATSGTGLFLRKYDNTGTATTSWTNIPCGSSSSTGYYFLNLLELQTGSFALIYVVPNTARYTIVNSSLTVTTDHVLISTSYASNMSTTGYLVACPLSGNALFVVAWYDQSYASYVNVCNTSGNMYNTNGISNGSYSSSYYRSTSICPTNDGNFVMSWSTGSGPAFQRYQFTSNYTNWTAGTTFYVDGSAVTNNYNTNLFAIQGGNFGLLYSNASAQTYLIFSTSSSLSSTTFGSPIAVNGTTGNSYYYSSNCFISNSYGAVGFMINPASTYYPSVVIHSTQALTNGQSLNGASYLPPNYLLQGVSVSSASAGQSASVVINGSVELNSNYPSLTTMAPFDYSGLGQFGNVGSVLGRTVTLKGAQ